VRQLFVVRYQVCYIDVAVVLLDKDILADLISSIVSVMRVRLSMGALPVEEGIVKPEFEDELAQL